MKKILRNFACLILVLSIATACVTHSTPTPPHPSATAPGSLPPATTPTSTSGGTLQNSKVGELAVSISPNFDKSFKQVAGRAPFTVTFTANISGGKPPYQVEWDFDGDGKTDTVEEKPKSTVFSKPGAYEASFVVKDADGQTARATRRIVAFGDAPIPNWKYGVTAHLERRRAGYYPTLDDVIHAAELMQAAGIQAARIDFNWDMLNPEKDVWKFDDYDAMVKIVRAHNVDILAIVDYVSWWASSAQDSQDWRVRLYSEPTNYYDFARYTYDVVTHFKNDVHVWEIWNEPNTVGFWKPKPDAAHYTQLLQEAYLATKYADPNAVVLFAGMAGNGMDGDDNSGLASNFVPNAYSAGAKNYFDVMAIHPYMLPNSGIDSVRQRIAASRAAMNQNGDEKKPLWLTEIGVPTDVPWWPTAPIQSESAVAAWLEQVYTKLWDQTPTIFWYSLQDQGVDVATEQKFGLLRLDFSPKASYDKLRLLTGK